MDRIIAIIEETDPIELDVDLANCTVTRHKLAIIVYKIFEQEVILVGAKEIRVSSDSFNMLDKTLAFQRLSEKSYLYSNINCYDFLQMLGDYNKIGYLMNVDFVEEKDKEK